ncbi:MAG: class I SAM-dependent methyltransferase [Minwuiales bacterium]|nr:class I SAM-dependent methyltransferase [Minwuiales bacterium]
MLDIGCGTGWLLRRIARSFPAARGIGLDLSGVMVETARQKAAAAGLDRLDFVNADWESPDVERLPGLSGKRINAIVCANAFHYFGDTGEAVAKMFRTLAPGGELLLLERAKERSVLTLIWDVLHRFLIRDQVRFYSSSELIELIYGAGFSNVEVKTKIKRWLWHNKFFTSVVLISAKKR